MSTRSLENKQNKVNIQLSIVGHPVQGEGASTRCCCLLCQSIKQYRQTLLACMLKRLVVQKTALMIIWRINVRGKLALGTHNPRTLKTFMSVNYKVTGKKEEQQ